MQDNEWYHTRYFPFQIVGSLSEVPLTCCKRCGVIVWDQTLHERAYHDNNQVVVHNHEGTGQEDSTDESDGAATEVEDLAGGGPEPLGLSRSAPAERPISSPPASRAGRTTAAGTGRKGRS
jgi:hypothetical protein